MKLIPLLVIPLCLGISSCQAQQNPVHLDEDPVFVDESGTTIERINLTEEEWAKKLSKQAFEVMRKQGTERAFTGTYWNHHAEGIYTCAACGLTLFSSETKFESGTGWPSFYQPVDETHIGEKKDNTFGMIRTEVHCNRCGGHLGHMFDDGPAPTGLRYCMNSISLKFEPNGQK